MQVDSAERQSHPTPGRGRAATTGLRIEWSQRFQLAAGQALGSKGWRATPC